MPEIVISESREKLAERVAHDFYDRLSTSNAADKPFHVALTGGTVGIECLTAVFARSTTHHDWSQVHFWWGDERWLPQGHSERNDQQAFEAGLDSLPIRGEQVHRFPASDSGLSLDEAAESYAAQLAQHRYEGLSTPRFDIVLLGMGPDGHVASLFPNHASFAATGKSVTAVRDSPKPPPERLSLTVTTLNNAERVWFLVAGVDKAPALHEALLGSSGTLLPAAAVRGVTETRWYLDRDASSLLSAREMTALKIAEI